MIRTIARYGVRHVPGSTSLRTLFGRNAVEGSALGEFEARFAAYHDMPYAISASYGRMAFYYILKALDLPAGSEIIFPALTFWVVPEIARVAGLHPVFVDVDPRTFNLNPELIEPAITARTCAIVPTHLYGQSCDMDPILEVSARNRLRVIEDCAHSLGATYRGRKVGTFGDASFFSFQMLKPLNTYGGGMAVVRDPALAGQIRKLAEAEPWPTAGEVRKKFLGGTLQRAFISPYGFTFSMFLAFYIASFFGNHDLTRYIWEKIRPLDPLPATYRKRYTNAQATAGLKMLEVIDALNAKSQDHARQLTEGLKGVNSVLPPAVIPGATSVYYQYCIRVSNPELMSHRAIRKGVDMEIMHVDICNKLDLFKDFASRCPGAESSEGTLQLPVYSSLRPKDVERILRVVSKACLDLPPLKEPETKRALQSVS
ncbi:MAG TPA: DegT/DnrJ/EryC1/StrS family aminotransferase [Acidobacteriota bacterium]|nr:DegT/DnrJ/EryC1/StrS family aminotransferase [Acidobacteriota bacterium]